MEGSVRGQATEGRMFTGVKIFSATKAKEREELGEQVTRWLRAKMSVQGTGTRRRAQLSSIEYF